MKMERQNINMKPRILILIPILIIGLGVLPKAQALSPAPDGGYPGQNTAEGQSALLHLAGGTYNTALGWASLGFNVTGNYNTGVGAATLLNNTASENTATGAGALLSNTTGTSNAAAGAFALFTNTEGSFNTAIGEQALSNNTTGVGNTGIGATALNSNTTGSFNTANGTQALHNNTTGGSNIALGFEAGKNLTTGSNNIDIGNAGVAGESGIIRIGTAGTQTATFIAGIRETPISHGGALAVGITADGQLGVRASSARFKEAIKPMDKASEAILALQPVTFRYKQELDPEGIPQFGLVAEEVEKVNPDLVARDDQGKAYTVRYEAVNAMLLNEFFKEHRKVEGLEATVAKLQSAFKAQAAQIQKVSDQLEADRATQQLVANN